MDAQTELERMRWELKLLVSKRLTAPFNAYEAARFDKLSRRELELLAQRDTAFVVRKNSAVCLPRRVRMPH